jgi:hypothetical protein
MYNLFLAQSIFTSSHPPGSRTLITPPPPDVDVVAHLVELPHTHDICREPRNVVDIIEGLVLTILAQEQNRTSALDSCHGVISEAH